MKLKIFILSAFLFAILVEVKSKQISDALEHRIDGYKTSKGFDITLSYVYQLVDQFNNDTRLFRQVGKINSYFDNIYIKFLFDNKLVLLG